MFTGAVKHITARPCLAHGSARLRKVGCCAPWEPAPRPRVPALGGSPAGPRGRQDVNARPLRGSDGPLACDFAEVRREFCGVCVKHR